jgi:hypothetical protein
LNSGRELSASFLLFFLIELFSKKLTTGSNANHYTTTATVVIFLKALFLKVTPP